MTKPVYIVLFFQLFFGSSVFAKYSELNHREIVQINELFQDFYKSKDSDNPTVRGVYKLFLIGNGETLGLSEDIQVQLVKSLRPQELIASDQLVRKNRTQNRDEIQKKFDDSLGALLDTPYLKSKLSQAQLTEPKPDACHDCARKESRVDQATQKLVTQVSPVIQQYIEKPAPRPKTKRNLPADRSYTRADTTQDVPWKKTAVQISLKKTGGGSIADQCSGFVVSPTLIVTAAHCFDGEVEPNGISFYDSGSNRFSVPGKIVRFDLNRGYNAFGSNASFQDIAWIQVDRIPGNYEVLPILERPDLIPDGAKIHYFGTAGGNKNLYEGKAVKPSAAAVKRDSIKLEDYNKYLIKSAAPQAEGGDSGGPLFVKHGGQYYLAGLVQEQSTFGDDSTASDKFTALGHHISWLENTSRENLKRENPFPIPAVGAQTGQSIQLVEEADDEVVQTYLFSAAEKYKKDLIDAKRITNGDDAYTQALNEFIEEKNRRGGKLLALKDQDQQVGILFYSIRNGNRAYIFDFEIDENSRGKGFGRGSLEAFEKEMKNRGMKSIQLHVFDHNPVAIQLYEKLGFKTTSTTPGGKMMEKTISR